MCVGGQFWYSPVGEWYWFISKVKALTNIKLEQLGWVDMKNYRWIWYWYFKVDIAKTQTNMKCAPKQVVWVGARENAEMESSEEKLALHLHFIHCAHLQNKCPELQGVNVAGTSMGEKRMQKTARRRYLDDCDLLANWPLDHHLPKTDHSLFRSKPTVDPELWPDSWLSSMTQMECDGCRPVSEKRLGNCSRQKCTGIQLIMQIDWIWLLRKIYDSSDAFVVNYLSIILWRTFNVKYNWHNIELQSNAKLNHTYTEIKSEYSLKDTL